jgi:hypothetical protein
MACGVDVEQVKVAAGGALAACGPVGCPTCQSSHHGRSYASGAALALWSPWWIQDQDPGSEMETLHLQQVALRCRPAGSAVVVQASANVEHASLFVCPW